MRTFVFNLYIQKRDSKKLQNEELYNFTLLPLKNVSYQGHEIKNKDEMGENNSMHWKY
jgi:hypothetical protein